MRRNIAGSLLGQINKKNLHKEYYFQNILIRIIKINCVFSQIAVFINNLLNKKIIKFYNILFHNKNALDTTTQFFQITRIDYL